MKNFNCYIKLATSKNAIQKKEAHDPLLYCVTFCCVKGGGMKDYTENLIIKVIKISSRNDLIMKKGENIEVPSLLQWQTFSHLFSANQQLQMIAVPK